MFTVFFKVTKKQDDEIKSLMAEEGYASKAEFFRFLLKFFKYHKSPEDIRLDSATKELTSILKKLNKQGKLDSPIDDQLADV